MSNAKATSAPQQPKEPCQRNRILVVDDEIRNLFRQLVKLELPQCKMEIAVNGSEALEMFRHTHHALLLLDVHMAMMDGEQTFMEIEKLCAEQHWEMPSVIFCTGHVPSPYIRGIIEQNPKHCLLCKPVLNDNLMHAIKARLNP